MAKHRVKVTVPTAQWAFTDADDETYRLAGGEHDLTLSDRGSDLKLLQALGSAADAGAIELRCSSATRQLATKHLGDEKAERKAQAALDDDAEYQAALEQIRDGELGMRIRVNHARVRDALDAVHEDATDAALDELLEAQQEAVELEREFHLAAEEVRP